MVSNQGLAIALHALTDDTRRVHLCGNVIGELRAAFAHPYNSKVWALIARGLEPTFQSPRHLQGPSSLMRYRMPKSLRARWERSGSKCHQKQGSPMNSPAPSATTPLTQTGGSVLSVMRNWSPAASSVHTGCRDRTGCWVLPSAWNEHEPG